MKNTNIAIFERNDKFLGALCEYFEKTDGFTVCATALSGDAALEALKANKPDVAIIDTLENAPISRVVKQNQR